MPASSAMESSSSIDSLASGSCSPLVASKSDGSIDNANDGSRRSSSMSQTLQKPHAQAQAQEQLQEQNQSAGSKEESQTKRDKKQKAAATALSQSQRAELDAPDSPLITSAIKHIAAHRGGIRTHSGILSGARVSYFKGKYLLSSLSECPAVTNSAVPPRAVAAALLRHGMLLRVEKSKRPDHVKSSGRAARILVPHYQQTQFDPAGFFVSRRSFTSPLQLLGSVVLVLVVLAGIMFPLWPPVMRRSVSYISYLLLGLVGLIFLIAILRLIIWVPLYLIGRPGWLFPNLFADVDFVSSFIPLWAWEPRNLKSSEKSSDKNSPSSASEITANTDSATRSHSRSRSRSHSRSRSRSRSQGTTGSQLLSRSNEGRPNQQQQQQNSKSNSNAQNGLRSRPRHS